MERRSRRLGLVPIALFVMVSGCAGRTGSHQPAHVGAMADPECCIGETNHEVATVSTADVWARQALRAGGPGLCRFDVAVSESPLRRDAFVRARIVGHVTPGEKLTLLDFIDRRLRILNRVVFDGGYWRKVQGERGDMGWLPAAEIEEIRGPCEAEGVALGGEHRPSEEGRR